MEAELVDVLCHYLDKFAEDEDIPTHVLLSLTCMADTGDWLIFRTSFHDKQNPTRPGQLYD